MSAALKEITRPARSLPQSSVQWTEVEHGRLQGQILGRSSYARVINHGYGVVASMEFPLGRLFGQEFPTVRQAQDAAEQWLTQVT